MRFGLGVLPRRQGQEVDTLKVTRRPWKGPDVITGLTMADYEERLTNVQDLSSDMTRAAVAICRSYNIRGLADVAYIANTIATERRWELASKDASLGVGHIWTNTRCPAYDSANPEDCVCREGRR